MLRYFYGVTLIVWSRLYTALIALIVAMAITHCVAQTAPVISGLSPNTGLAGTSVTISGTGFGSTQSTSTVTFNGTIVVARGRNAVSWSNSSIAVVVPSGVTSGNVIVRVGVLASNGANFTVAAKAAATVILSSSNNTATYGSPVTFTATTTGSAGAPTGTVTFLDGSASIGSATINAGTATFNTALLAAGTHSITASYSGDINYNAAQSSVLTESVSPAPAPHIYLQDPQALPSSYTGSQNGVQTLSSGQSQPVSLAAGDFDEDGVQDVAVGYVASGGGTIAIYQGNLDAFAPQSSASWHAIATNQFPSAFVGTNLFSTPRSPDFLASGKMTGHGHIDLVTAARGDGAFYLFTGDGHGNFASPQAISVPEMKTVTALAAGRFGSGNTSTSLLVGVNGGANGPAPAVLLYTGSDAGLSLVASFPVPAPITEFAFGDLNGDSIPDVAMVSGGSVLILYGPSATSSTALQPVSLPYTASALVLGSFVHDRDPHLQMAILSPDGSIRIIAHSGFDSRGWSSTDLSALRQARLHRAVSPFGHAVYTPGGEGWQVIETFSSVAPSSSGPAPILLRTRISDHAADDLLVFNPAAGEMRMISHANVATGASSFTFGQQSIRAYSAATPVAALPMHVNVDGRLGLVMLHQGQVAPSTMAPLPDPTFIVNTMIDSVDANPGDGICADSQGRCSLRAAVMEANATAGGDTIMLPAGVYTLTIPGNDKTDASTGHLDILDGVTIVGADPETTVIQAGTAVNSSGIPNGIDKVFSINPFQLVNGMFTNSPGFDTNLSNITIRYGLNTSSLDPFGGGFDWDAGSDGAGTITITKCKIINNAVVIADSSVPLADGGGMSFSSEVTGTGSVNISGSTIQGNLAQDIGGGLFVGALPLVMSNTNVLMNQAVDAQGIGQGGGRQAGGGIFFGIPPGQSVIQKSSISMNQAGLQGGGIFTNLGLSITQSTISGNLAGQKGGGISSDLTNDTTFVIATNITGNTVTDPNIGTGGGIEVEQTAAGSNFSISYSRIAGNIALTGNGLNNAGGTVTASNNWWACNQGPTVTPCDLLTNSGSATIAPWLTLQNTASPSSISANGSSTLTASFLQDSAGGAVPPEKLGVFNGVPISFQNAVDGVIVSPAPVVGPGGTAGATFNGNNVGAGRADAVVDGFHATANISVSDCPGDLTLSAPTSLQTVLPGGTASYTLNAQLLNGLAGQKVVPFVLNGLPGGATASFNPPFLTATGTSTMTIATTNSTPAGNYAPTVLMTCGNKNQATGVNLSVQDFTLASTSNATQPIHPGDSVSYTLTVSPQNGFTGAVSFSVSGLPPGATYTFAPNSINTSGSSVLTISTSSSTPADDYLLTITASSGGLSHINGQVITVAGFVFLPAMPSSRTVVQGATASYQMNAFPVGGFNSPIALSVSGLPSGATFSPSSIPGPGPFTLTITTSGSTPSGPPATGLTVTGISGALTGTANVSLLVTSAPPPVISDISPTDVVAGSSSVSLNVDGSNFPGDAVVRINGSPRFTSVVSASQLIAALLPADLTASGHPGITIFSPSSGAYSDVTPLAVFRYGDVNFDNTLNIVDLATLANQVAGNITGFDSAPSDVYQDGVIDAADLTTLANYLAGNIHHLPVVPTGDFSISTTQASQSITAGSSASFTVSTTDTGGFIGSVKLSISGLPPGATAAFNPTVINGMGTSTLTISTGASTGTFSLIITGTSGSRVHSTAVTLVVNAATDVQPSPPPSPCSPGSLSGTDQPCPAPQVSNE